MWIWLLAALAEPPPYTPLNEAVRDSSVALMGVPVRVEFEALRPGEVLEGSTLHAFWMEYRVVEVLAGAVSTDSIVRVYTDASGCEPMARKVWRDGTRVLQSEDDGVPHELDASLWLRDRQPTVLLLDERDGRLVNHGFGSTPQPATETHLAAVKKLLAKKRRP